MPAQARWFETSVAIDGVNLGSLRSMMMSSATVPANQQDTTIDFRGPYLGSQLHLHVEEIEQPRFWPDAVQYQRYQLAVADATSLINNPRNLEWFWRSVWRHVAYALVHGASVFDIQEEVVLWSFLDPSRNPGSVGVELAHTIRVSPAFSKTLKPDLSCLLHLRHNGLPGMPEDGWFRHRSSIWELKRPISRRLADDDGYPLSQFGAQQLSTLLNHAVDQVQLQAVLHFDADSYFTHRQTRMVLFAASGKIFTFALTSRDQIRSTSIASAQTIDLRAAFDNLLDQIIWDDLMDSIDSETSVDPGAAGPPALWPITADKTFMNVQWSLPCHVDSPMGQQSLLYLRDHFAQEYKALQTAIDRLGQA
ncbi:hypothetical protein L226DRAFT_103975 [Lentinus tigrinus ALCF2SS1-7]|uniref:Uncharacterized protein n=1 Tax=Lentinus tigrinus ALCF2SS1-6 TaxID=1328759 RepID=A0A5C2S812_9APHY|nr:hypothetical protein L227DRAFT_612244 [Lentinus tigrinus ALCF2SS1-6]RPD73596.1 hypothetical protein L226DRAFT_103975 [Lentinus tigrinus ALCF2SS1-7]